MPSLLPGSDVSHSSPKKRKKKRVPSGVTKERERTAGSFRGGKRFCVSPQAYYKSEESGGGGRGGGGRGGAKTDEKKKHLLKYCVMNEP